MICHVKQSFEVKNALGERFSARNGDIVVPPDWVAHNDYFKLLCDAGKVTVHIDSKSLELAQAKEELEAKEVKQEQPKAEPKKGKK